MSQLPLYEYPASNSNQDNAGNYFNAYTYILMDFVKLFDTYNQIYRQESEQLNEIEEKEIKQGMDEIQSGKCMHFNSTEEYLKYLDNSK